MIPEKFKPMLAGKLTKADLGKLKFPLTVQPKLDGIRCVVFGGVAYSRKLLPIPNKYVQFMVHENADFLEGMDGELMVGQATDSSVYLNTMSGVMSGDGEPDFSFHVFDRYGDNTFDGRYYGVLLDFSRLRYPMFQMVSSEEVVNEEELMEAYSGFMAKGYEGLIIRGTYSRYKYGRSTINEGHLLKYKQFEDAEAKIIGFKERMHNANEQQRDNLGHSKRSSAKAGKVATGTLGAFVCLSLCGRIEFDLGTGFNDDQRSSYWSDQESLLGRIVKYRYFDGGAYEKPRHPVFLGFRDPIDMGEL